MMHRAGLMGRASRPSCTAVTGNGITGGQLLSVYGQRRGVVSHVDFRHRMQVINPANQQVLDVIEPENNISQRVSKARNAQKDWACTSLMKRKEAIVNFQELLQKEKEEVAVAMSQETGKPISQARNEVSAMDARIRFFLDNFMQALQPRVARTTEKFTEEVRYEPLGVVLNISAWNYPLFVSSNVFIPALLAGNAVLYKPSEHAALFGKKIGDMLHRSGVPKDLFVTFLGSGDVAEQLLSEDINGVFFTGSNATGTKIAQKVAPKMIRTQLELGGKDPSYVCDDVNVESTAEALADGAFYNTGQSCCSVERIYVHTKVYDKFVDHFVKTVAGFKMGDPSNKDTYIGPLTLPKHGDFLENQVKDAVSKGARVLIGGKKAEGGFFEPTVLVDVDHTMDVMKEESFGPIIGIKEVNGDEEAIQLMNDAKYGLTSSVYTNSGDRARTLLPQLNSGTVYWNACDRVSPFVPWTGRKGTGIGCTLGIEGIHAFANTKSYHLIHPSK